MDRKVSVHARVISLAIAGVLSTAAPAIAQEQKPAEPTPAARLLERALERYQAEDWTEAAKLFEQAYALEPNPDLLYAWGQSERFGGDCVKALELFDELLKQQLTDKNRAAVETNIARCKEQLAANQAAASPEPSPDPAPAPQPEAVATADTPPAESPRPWYKDPIGGALVGTGVVGVGVGIAFLVSSSSADSSADDSAGDYQEFADLKAKAERHDKIGSVAVWTGAAFVGAGVAWYVLRTRSSERSGRALTGWVTGDSAGVAVGGSF